MMSDPYKHNPDRLDELMVDAATQGLSLQDAAELQAALAHDKALAAEAMAYELAATAIELSLAGVRADEALPVSLRDKLVADAAQYKGAAAAVTAPPLKFSAGAAQQTEARSNRFSWTDGRAFGWYAAIAATLALCVLLLQPNTRTGQPDPAATLAQQYEALAAQPGTVRATWGFAGGDADPRYANATGQVIWNNQTQTGYMKLDGMPINNPTELQYQLWIVDASRDTSVENTNRVDGGVFNINAQGEVIVPIDAKLLARDAAVFAITAETPGGVVESKGPLQVVAVVDQES